MHLEETFRLELREEKRRHKKQLQGLTILVHLCGDPHPPVQLEWRDLHSQLCHQLLHELVGHHVNIHISNAMQRGSLKAVGRK